MTPDRKASEAAEDHPFSPRQSPLDRFKDQIHNFPGIGKSQTAMRFINLLADFVFIHNKKEFPVQTCNSGHDLHSSIFLYPEFASMPNGFWKNNEAISYEACGAAGFELELHKNRTVLSGDLSRTFQ
jgi:hypothetical protein